MVTAYLRVITDKQSVENQRNEIQRFAKNHSLCFYQVATFFCAAVFIPLLKILQDEKAGFIHCCRTGILLF